MALIQVVNDSNTVLIDDEYSNACLALKSNVSLVVSGINWGSSQTDRVIITYTSSDPPQLALELSDIKVVSLFVFRNGNTWTWQVFFHKDYYNRSLNYYIFTVPSAVSDAGGIVKLYNSAAKLVFDSNLKYMRVFGTYNAPRSNVTISSGLVAGRTYAAISVVSSYLHSVIQTPPNQPAAPYNFIDTAGTSLFSRSANSLMSWAVAISGAQVTKDQPGNIVDDINNGILMLLDVTGF